MEFDREAFIDGYVECALWADCMPPEAAQDEGIQETGGKEHLEIRPDARDKMSADCQTFIDENRDDLIKYCEEMGHAPDFSPGSCAGHDFWLTRNGHGAGYWDRGLGELGERLTKAAKVYNTADDHTPFDCGDGTADV